MKVLYLITKSNWGGAQRYVYDLATHLPKDRYEAVVAFGGDGILKTRLEEAGIRTVRIGGLERDIRFFREPGVFFEIFALIKKERPAVVHLNSTKIGGIGGLAARLLGVPRIIFTAHGWAFKEKRPFFARQAIAFLSWVTMLLVHTTILVSKDDEERVRAFPRVSRKTKLIYNGIDRITFEEKSAARKMLLGEKSPHLGSEVVWIGTIAELHKNKGVAYALEAFSIFLKRPRDEANGNARFIFAVIGEGEERQSLERFAAEQKISDRVFFLGYRGNAASLLKAFDIFILPSLKEGLPYAVLEAGRAKVPVIATNAGGVREIVDDMTSGIVVKAKRPREIEQALAFLVSHDRERREFAERLKETVEKKFALPRMVAETTPLYGQPSPATPRPLHSR